MFEQVVGTAVAYLDLDTSKFSTKFQSAWNQLKAFGDESLTTADKFQTFGNGLSSVGGQMTKTFTLPIAGAFAVATKKTMDFDEAMSNVQALAQSGMKDVTAETEALRQKALELGGSTKFTSKEVADAFGYMALAGWKTEDMLSGISGVLDLAASSGMDLATASDIVTDYLSAFGKESDYATTMVDMMSYAQANANTSTQMLGEAFGNSASFMHTAGQEMNTTIALLAMLSNEGLKGSEAGTALSAAMRDIVQKMYGIEEASKAAELASLGYTSVTGDMNDLIGKQVIEIGNVLVPVSDLSGKYRDMIDIIQDVEKATNGMESADKSAALMTTFTSRSIKAMGILLTEGADKTYKFRDALDASGGTAKEISETMLDNLAGSLTYLSSALDNFLIKVGDRLAPYIRSIADWLTKITEKLSSMSDEEFDKVVKIAAIVAALGPCLSILGKVFTAIGNIIKVLDALKGFKIVSKIGDIIKVIGSEGAAGSLLSKISGIGMFIGGTITAVKNFFDMWKNGWDLLKTILEAIGIAIAAIGAVLLGAPALVAAVVAGIIFAISQIIIVIHDHWDEIVNWWQNTVKPWFKEKTENLKQWFKDLGQAISDWWQSVKDKFAEWKQNIADWWNGLKQTVSEKLNEIWNNISKWATDAWNKTKAWFTNLNNKFSAWWENVKTMIGSKIQEIWNDITNKIKEIWDDITGFFDNILSKLSEIWEKITSSITNFFNKIKEKLTSLFDSLKEHLGGLFEKIKSAIESIMTTLKTLIESFTNIIKNIFETMQTIVETIVTVMQALVEKVIEFLKNIIESALNVIKSLWESITNFVEEVFGKVVEKLQTLFENLWEWVKEIPKKFIELGKGIISSLWEGMKAAWTKVSDWLTEKFDWLEKLTSKVKDIANAISNKVTKAVSGSHASGLDYVPYDGYVAELHRGERVLTKQEADSYNNGRSTSNSGDTYYFYNTKDDPYEYARQIRRTKKELAFG